MSLWVLVTASFLMIHLIPGDPVRAALGPTAPASLVAARRESLGLNDPIWLQYLHYLQGLFTGDLGTSIITQLPVAEIIRQRLPATLELAGLAFIVAVAIAVPLGVAMGVVTRRGHGRRTELAFTTSSVVLGIIPDFLIGVGLVYVFGVSLGWLPVAGNDTPSAYVLPVVALAIGPAVILARIMRIEMVAVLEADFVRTARAKRLPASSDLPRPRAAERADRHAHDRRTAAQLAGRRDRPRRERLRLARARQHDRVSPSSTRTIRSCRPSCSSTASACWS